MWLSRLISSWLKNHRPIEIQPESVKCSPSKLIWFRGRKSQILPRNCWKYPHRRKTPGSFHFQFLQSNFMQFMNWWHEQKQNRQHQTAPTLKWKTRIWTAQRHQIKSWLRKEENRHRRKFEWIEKKKQKYYAHNTRHLILQQKSIMNWCDQKTDEEISRVNPNVLARCFFPVVSPVLAIYLRYGSHINRPTHGVYGAR